ncbi:GGDEF domain-containing protein [Marinobacterium sp. D7]|uniref:GGDEF domain-containing protein n=1 Tax=Marinobacterium ramblicola TaxID=2849041 RepID=UPI001C2DE56C|nr:GGDEF domain-containing protein [Marinobacterium ramblicola]MBV1787258.1 GGDEF domain-containing protein [Marinobacterium ramblicola]
MRPKRSGAAHRIARFSLARTMQLAVLTLLLLLGLTVWISMPLLDGIVEKARQTSEEQLPQINRWRHNGERAELLHSYINTLFWTEDPAVSRSTRLQAQVLVHSFAFEADPAIKEQADRVMTSILALLKIRAQQQQIQRTLGDIAQMERQISEQIEPLTNIDAFAAAELYKLNHELIRLSTATASTSIHNSNWGQLAHELRKVDPALSKLSAQLPLQGDTILRYRGLLLQQLIILEQMQTLIAESNAIHAQALSAQQQLSGMLNSDAALKTQQLAERVEKDARQVRSYTFLLLSLFALMVGGLLIGFHLLVLRPILQATHALEQVSRGEPLSKKPARTLFSELNAIAQSVQRYAEMTLELHSTNAELRQLSQIDGLTGLGNRLRFDRALQSEYDRACRHGHALCLILFDLDHFKQINDEHGHLFGDQCLQAFAQLLKQYSQRSGEVSARYGGEEFVLILPEVGLEVAQRIAEQVRSDCTNLELHSEGGATVHLSTSAGLIHLQNARLSSPEALLREADAALYRAKQQGRNRVVTVTNTPGIQLCGEC